MNSYTGYQQDWDAATDKFTVNAEDRTPDQRVQWVEASAGTGSRYVVCLTRLSEVVAASVGANLLVSVVHPMPAVYPIFADSPDDLTDGYLIEKFCRGLQHGGDQAALCLTIREALLWLNTPLDPKRVDQIGPGRWAIEGHDVLQTGTTYQVWRDGYLLTTEPGMLEARKFIDNQRVPQPTEA